MRNRSKPQKKKSKWLLTLIIVVLVLILGAATYWGVGLYNSFNGLQKDPDESIINNPNPDVVVEVPTWEGKERVNILIMGGDAREADEKELARSDSMMVASIDPVTKQANLISVLRDTYTEIDGHRDGRINNAITLGGAPLAMKTIGDLLGLEIQYFIYADFEGFKALVDSIGGVNFTVEKDMKYTDNADKNRYDIDLKAGYQHLDGDKALQYVRFRHDALSDYTRTERQRNFLTTVAKEMQSTWNLIRMKEIIDDVSPYIDTNMSAMDMIKLGQLGFGLKIGDSAQVPPFELLREVTRDGAEVIGYTSKEDIQDYVQEVLTPKPDPTPATTDTAADDGAATNSSTTTSP